MKKILVIAVSIFSQLAHAIAEEEKDSQDLMDDPNYKKYIDKFIEQIKSQESLPLSEQRKLDDQAARNEIIESIKDVQDIEIIGKDNNTIPLRLYFPSDKEDLPIFIFYHGGGWMYGSITRSDALCRKFANHLECIVVSVEYRLSPENPFPKPLEDCYEALKWISAAYPNNDILIGGESAGGNLAAATSLLARDDNGPKIAAQILINPVISSTIQNEPYEQCPDRHFLTKDLMKYFWNMYLQNPSDYSNPYASPEKSNEHTSLPCTFIITAEYDPLRKEADAYALTLKQAGVPVYTKCFAKVIHGFMAISLYEDKQKVAWIKEIKELLNKIKLTKI